MRLDFSDLSQLVRAFKDRTLSRPRHRRRHETTTEPRRSNDVANFFEAVVLFNKLVEEQKAKEKEAEKQAKEAAKKPPESKRADPLGMAIFLTVMALIAGFGLSIHFALTMMETASKLVK